MQVYPAIIYGTVTLDTTERNGSVLVASGICLGIGIFVPPIVVSTVASPAVTKSFQKRHSKSKKRKLTGLDACQILRLCPLQRAVMGEHTL